MPGVRPPWYVVGCGNGPIIIVGELATFLQEVRVPIGYMVREPPRAQDSRPSAEDGTAVLARVERAHEVRQCLVRETRVVVAVDITSEGEPVTLCRLGCDGETR